MPIQATPRLKQNSNKCRGRMRCCLIPKRRRATTNLVKRVSVVQAAAEIRLVVLAVLATSLKHSLVAARHLVEVSGGQAAHLADKILKPLQISHLKKQYLVVKRQSRCARLCAVMTARDPARKRARRQQRVPNVVALAKCDECVKACLAKW